MYKLIKYKGCIVYVGWKMECGSTCIHCTVLPSHNDEIAKEFINNLKESVSIVKVLFIIIIIIIIIIINIIITAG